MAYVRIRVPSEIVRGTSPKELTDVVSRYYAEKTASAQIGTINLQPADNGAVKTQSPWILYFNDLEKAMISAPDVYQAGKYASDEVLDSLRKDFNESWLVLSTRTIYSGNNLSGRIIHNYGSEVVKPSQRDVKVIPVYEGTPLAQALWDKEGVEYIQSLLDTRDDTKEITGTLEKISGKMSDNISLWTPSQSSRKNYSERAVGFGGGYGRFRVVGYDFIVGLHGRSRGVSMGPRSGREKK